MREMAEKRDVTIVELNRIAKKDKDIDKELDERQKNLGKTEDNFVIDARLGFHFIPHSIKVFLTADLEKRSRRIYKDSENNVRPTENNTSVEITQHEIVKRQQLESERYMRLYDVDYLDPTNYDVVIDTTHLSVEATCEEIMRYLKKNHKL